jgi:predicted RNA polymerase sigma factor
MALVGARPPTEVMVSLIDELREEHGVEPICQQLPITRLRDWGRKGPPEQPPPWVERWEATQTAWGTAPYPSGKLSQTGSSGARNPA